LDSRKCISYLTIELRGTIPVELREQIGGLIYGCDICQDVCPWNVRFSRELPDPSPFAPRDALGAIDAVAFARQLLAMQPGEFAVAFRGSPMKRAKLRGLKRNAVIALGNVGSSDDVPALTAALDDPEPLIREHAAWALARFRASHTHAD
jgi:epoxyqueuosine reductase